MSALLLLFVLGATANEQAIDAFDYADAAAVQRAWIASEKSPDAVTAKVDGRNVAVLPAPFGTRPELARVVLDRKVKLDLAMPGEFALEICSSDPQTAGQVTLYFHSGGGWYGSGRGLKEAGWQTLGFSKASFHTEGKPAGWDKIDGIRIAVWRSQEKDATVQLRRLAARWNDVAVVVPADEAASGDGELRVAVQSASSMSKMLGDLGLGADTVDEGAVAEGALGHRRVAILAYNPRMREETIAALVRFVADGGKVFACYQLPTPLGAALGFQADKYVRQERPGQFAAIRLEGDIAGMPAVVRQNSWNIVTAEPAEHGARVVGRWLDEKGEPTGHAALLVSEKGAYFSHILLPGDHEAKLQLLAAVLGRLAPPLWEEMARNRLESLGHVGHVASLDALTAYVRAGKDATAAERLAAAMEAIAAARRQVAEKAYPGAIEAAGKASELLRDAYVRSEPSRAVEGRAWWNHSGTGAYPGDWERTCRELAEGGFNMVLPNMLWGGVAHYASDVLPRSSTYEKYGDQIEQCVGAAHGHGLEVHVWKVNFNLGAAPKEFVEKLRQEGRTQVSVSGEQMRWLCPSHPANFELELESMLEVARKYDVDGLHFDYIRYPGPQCCYCDGCRERFEAVIGRKVASWPEDCHSGSLVEPYTKWRCQQITRLVEAVSREAKKIKPSIKISAAVFSGYPHCRETVAQDWASWVRSGYLDFMCPMDYTNSDQVFQGLVRNQLELVEGRVPVYPGIGCTASNSRLSADRVVGQIHEARELGAAGFTIFNLSEDTIQNIVPAVGVGAGREKAVPPHGKK